MPRMTCSELKAICDRFGLIASMQNSGVPTVPYECHWVAFYGEHFDKKCVELWTSNNGRYGVWKFNIYIVADGNDGHLEVTDDWGERANPYPIWETDPDWLIERLTEFSHNYELLCEELAHNSIKNAAENLEKAVGRMI